MAVVITIKRYSSRSTGRNVFVAIILCNLILIGLLLSNTTNYFGPGMNSLVTVFDDTAPHYQVKDRGNVSAQLRLARDTLAATGVGHNSNRTAITNQTKGVNGNSPTPLCSPRSRMKYIRQQCQTPTMRARIKENRERSTYLVVDDTYRVALYITPKIASTTLLKTLIDERRLNYTPSLTTGWRRFHNIAKQSTLRAIRVKHLETVDNYTKMIVLRNPFDRLVSAYHNLITNPKNTLYLPTQQKIREEYATKQISFSQFVSWTLAGNRNVHWDTYALGSRICELQYDHVYRLETFKVEENELFMRMGVNITNKRNPHFNKARPSTSTSTSTVTSTFQPRHLAEYEDIPANNITRLRDLYSAEIALFGYDLDAQTLMTTCRVVAESGQHCC